MNSRAQAGQALVLVALAAIVIFGMLAVAVDGGRAMINRRALQSAADSASDSAMRMVLQDYHDQVAGRALSFSDCNIHDRVAEIATASNTNALGSGIDDGTGGTTAPVVQYVDPTGAATPAGAGAGLTSTPSCPGAAYALNLCSSPSQTGCVAGVAHTPQYTQPTYVMTALGVRTTVQKATSTSVFTIHGPITNGFGPWMVWDQDCVTPGGTFQGGGVIDPGEASPPGATTDTDPLTGETSLGADNGDIVIFHDNHWSKPGQQAGQITGCGDGRNTASSSLKGFIDTWLRTPPSFDLFTLNPVGAPTPDCNTKGGTFIATVTSLHVGDCIQTLQGGNKSEPDPCVMANGPTGIGNGVLILPEIDGLDGQGGNYAAHVTGFVAGRPIGPTPPAGCTGPGTSNGTIKIVFVCQSGSDSTKCIPPPGELTTGSGFLK
jgi:Flp pilus assembly protein TadG